MEPCVARDLVEDRLPVLAPLHALINVQQTIPHATAMAPPCAHPTPKAARARSHRLTGPRARENARVSFAEPSLWNRIMAHLSVFARRRSGRAENRSTAPVKLVFLDRPTPANAHEILAGNWREICGHV
jgi:hypothetical protein